MIPQFAKQSGRDWQDEVYVKMMADELVARHVDLGDMAAVTAAIRAANFSERSTARLAEKAAARARELQHS